jgi:hypothetical protein
MPFHDKVADFLDDVIPNEIKPYLGTVAATAVPAYFNIPGGAIGDFLAGGGTDILMQKLLYGSDEDRDTDYLSAGMSGILGALAGAQPAKRRVDLKEAGIEFNPEIVSQDEYMASMQSMGLSATPSDYVDYLKQFEGTGFTAIPGADTSEKLLERLNLPEGNVLRAFPENTANQAGFMNVLESDVLRGAKNFATPFGSVGPDGTSQLFGNIAGSDTPLLDIGGELLSTVSLAQVGQTPSQVRDAAKALEAAEREYNNYLATLDAENRARIEDDINARIDAHKRFMKLAGFTDAEIDDALVTGGYISSGETVFAAQGGRIGFDMGGDTGGMTDRMGLGNYMEAEKVRTEFMDKMKRGLQAAEMNMKLNDPGLMRFINALPFVGEGFYTREEMRFPSMKERYEANIEKMKRDQARDDYEKRQLQKQLRKENFDMMVDMVDDRFSDNREQRKMAKKGGRMTPQGDPISPDVPNGMQMDLRGGGFIPLGTKPKADDVPAMVGLNEFVLNDEAVSGIGKLITGKPDPRAGARALYQLQDQMEAIV